MIRNRLAELLSERSLKITRVARETNISRNTITSTAQNDSKMIQLETINSLCKFLGVSPNEFFQYVPIDLDYHLDITSFSFIVTKQNVDNGSYSDLEFTFDLFIDCDYKGKVKTFELEGKVDKVTEFDDEVILDISIIFTNDIERAAFRDIEKEIPVGFHAGIKEDIEKLIEEAFNNRLEEESRAEDYYDLFRYSALFEYDSEILPFTYT